MSTGQAIAEGSAMVGTEVPEAGRRLAAEILERPPGFRRIHPDGSVNFQCNRWLTWMSPEALDDVVALAATVDGYPALTDAFLGLGDRLSACGRSRDAAIAYRGAEFFLPPDDPRKAPMRRRFTELLRAAYGVSAEHMASVPYEGGALPAYRIGRRERGTVVITVGFDSYVEELFPMMFAFAERGYEVVGFDGPGQGGALGDSGLALTRDWHRPVSAVLDHFGLGDVTLLGISLGGGLSMRAAVREPRVTRIIADDVLTDLRACNLRHLPPAARLGARVMTRLRMHRLLDAMIRRRMRRDLLVSWGITQGQYVLGVDTPHEYLAGIAEYHTADVSAEVRADVLLLAAEEDHLVPLSQLGDQARWLTSARSVTSRRFTREEEAQNHCHIGNFALSIEVMLDWLDGLDKRDARLAERNGGAE